MLKEDPKHVKIVNRGAWTVSSGRRATKWMWLMDSQIGCHLFSAMLCSWIIWTRKAMLIGRSSCFNLDIIQARRRCWWNCILSEDNSLQNLPCFCQRFVTTSSSHCGFGCISAQIGECQRVLVLEIFHGQNSLFGGCLCRSNCRTEDAGLPQPLNNSLKMRQKITYQRVAIGMSIKTKKIWSSIWK